ncbi:MAG: mechanosensitive ion channel [Desulfurobacteriaceae bacterium]
MVGVESFLPYAVAAFKALVVFVVGWLVAAGAREVTSKLLGKLELLKEQKEFVRSISNLAYYFILLVTFVGVLEILGLKYVTQPFLDLLNEVASYLPNLIGAGLILFLGILFARIAREFVRSLLETFGIGEFGKKYGVENLGGAVADAVYLFVVLFVVISALNALQIDAVTRPAVLMLSSILEAVPKVIAALLIFGIIYYVGRFVADVAVKLIDDLNLEKIAGELGLSSEKVNFESLVRYLILTFSVLLGLSQAFHYLEAEALYRLTYSFTVVAFKLVVASLILFAGAYLGNLFEKKVEKEEIGRFIKVAFILAALFLALPYVGVSPEVVEIVVFSVSFGLGLAFALAFGLGGKSVAEEMLRKLFSKDVDKEV